MTEQSTPNRLNDTELLSIIAKRRLFWAVIVMAFAWTILILYKLSKTEYQDTIDDYNKTKKEYVYIADTTHGGVSNSLDIALQAWENTVGMVDKSMSALSNDIATLELMVTILTIIIGLFAYLGYVNLDEIRNKMKALDEEARKKMDTIQDDANKKIDFMQREVNLRIREADEVAKSKILSIEKQADEKLEEIDEIKEQSEELLKILRNEADATINPSYIEAELDFIAIKLREKQLRGEQFDATDLFDLGRYHYARGYYQKAIERFADVYKKEPNFPQITFYLGMAYDDLPNFKEAISYYTIAFDTETEFRIKALALSNRAYTYIEIARDWKRKSKSEDGMNSYKLAENDFLASLELINDDPIVLYGLSIVNREVGNQGEGLKYFNMAEDLIHRKHEFEILYSKKQYAHMSEALNNYYRFTK